ncbi:MAG: dihydropteroate synthase [Firmicutes bacterium]|nr:dihydropteroate synthase [Bacillota bacterium]
MGILNVTPDSFSDGGRYMEEQQAVTHALAMLADGADIIDIGGESTRPGHVPIDAAEELRRVIPAIRAIRAAVPQARISIDSSRAAVADAAMAAGANILNDQWGLQRDPAMAEVAAKYQAPTIVMHNQQGTAYSDLMPEIIRFLRQSLRIAAAAGLPPELIIVDPGVGFGKTVVQNLDVIRDLDALRVLGRPILLGTSRKGTIGKVLGGLPVDDRVEGTAATVSIGIDRGADIVRVHDVKQMKRVAVMTDAVVRPARGGFRSQ